MVRERKRMEHDFQVTDLFTHTGIGRDIQLESSSHECVSVACVGDASDTASWGYAIGCWKYGLESEVDWRGRLESYLQKWTRSHLCGTKPGGTDSIVRIRLSSLCLKDHKDLGGACLQVHASILVVRMASLCSFCFPVLKFKKRHFGGHTFLLKPAFA